MNFKDIVKKINQLNEGISQQDLADAVYNRLERNHPDVITRHGMEVVGDTVLDVAKFHAGADDLGTSDIGILVREVLNRLGRDLSEQTEFNPTDTVKLDIPLLLRILEYSKEDAETDLDLHFVAQNLIELGASGQTLTMQDYEKIIKKSSDQNQNS